MLPAPSAPELYGVQGSNLFGAQVDTNLAGTQGPRDLAESQRCHLACRQGRGLIREGKCRDIARGEAGYRSGTDRRDFASRKGCQVLGRQSSDLRRSQRGDLYRRQGGDLAGRQSRDLCGRSNPQSHPHSRAAIWPVESAAASDVDSPARPAALIAAISSAPEGPQVCRAQSGQSRVELRLATCVDVRAATCAADRASICMALRPVTAFVLRAAIWLVRKRGDAVAGQSLGLTRTQDADLRRGQRCDLRGTQSLDLAGRQCCHLACGQDRDLVGAQGRNSVCGQSGQGSRH